MDLTKGIILEHLEHLDVLSEDFPKDKTFILTIIGGAAFMLHDLTDRPTTTDIDAFVSVNDDKFTLSSFEILLGDEISESISSSLDINSDVYFFKLKDFIMEVENEETFISPSLDAEILNLIIRTPSIEI